MVNAMLKGRVKTGRSHLLNTELNPLEKSGLKTTTEQNERICVWHNVDKPNLSARDGF